MISKEEILSFSLNIENLVEKKNISYMDAIVLYCENNDLEIEVAAKMLSSSIKANLKTEAEELHFLPKSNINRLPL